MSMINDIIPVSIALTPLVATDRPSQTPRRSLTGTRCIFFTLIEESQPKLKKVWKRHASNDRFYKLHLLFSTKRLLFLVKMIWYLKLINPNSSRKKTKAERINPSSTASECCTKYQGSKRHELSNLNFGNVLEIFACIHLEWYLNDPWMTLEWPLNDPWMTPE